MKPNFSQISDELLEREYIKRYCVRLGEQVSNSSVAANHLKTLLIRNKEKEHFAVLFLNGQNLLIKAEILFEGSLTSSAVFPREIVKKVIEYDAACIILGHNHPSGNLKPSTDDISITKKIKDVLKLMDVPVLDHLVIGYGKSEFFSLADHALL